MTAFIKKGVSKMDTLEDFPRSLGLHRTGVPCWWWWSPPREVSAFRVVEGRKEGTREGVEEKGMSARFQPDQSLHQLLPMCFLSEQAGFPERVWVCVYVNFFTAQLINVRRMSGSERITHFSLTPLGKFRDPGGCPGFIYHIHPPLMGSLSQLACG